MSTYVFKSGDRLLDGYTVEKPLGHGGFGEVYHAKSAAGKDVALKLIQRFLDVELRGVGHCLNLKHSNLVTIYDVRPDADGRQWIVMEYVAGESLADAIEQHPGGMPVDDALRWLEPICQGVEHLHQAGIVHRDLKPGNIFDDRGTVKVGDYGLAKFITASKRSAQTQSVGTLHYMAPEVGSGRYGREVDVYAVGVILYEMLTGKVPFDGETPTEILMKHLTGRPDLDTLPVAFRGVVARMLAKNPNDRYGSLASVLTDLKARLADAAHAEAIGEPSQYPAYEESIVSRPGMSDWLERPFDQLPDAGRRSGQTSPSARRRGWLLASLQQHPLLTAACLGLTILLLTSPLPVLYSELSNSQHAVFAFLVWAWLNIFASAAFAAWGFLMRANARPAGDQPYAGRERLPRLPDRPSRQPAGRVPPEFQPTVLAASSLWTARAGAVHSVSSLGDSPARDQSAQSPAPPRPPRARAVVLTELHELDGDWQAYCQRHLKRKKDGQYDIPGIEETRVGIWIAGLFSVLLAGAAVLLGIAGTTAGFVVMMLLAAGVLAAVTMLPLLGQLKIAHVYPRSERNYRAERRNLLAELGAHGEDVERFLTTGQGAAQRPAAREAETSGTPPRRGESFSIVRLLWMLAIAAGLLALVWWVTPNLDPVQSDEAAAAYVDSVDGAFRCLPPAGWEVADGGQAGSAWVRFSQRETSIEIREVVALGHTLARPDRQPDQTVDGVTSGPESGDGESGSGPIRTAISTVLVGDVALEITCRGPDRDWNRLQPIFDQVIASITARGRV